MRVGGNEIVSVPDRSCNDADRFDAAQHSAATILK